MSEPDHSSSDVLIAGAGAAGLLAAIAAAQRGARVLVVEHLPRPGVKLLATGGGRCNLTNTDDRSAFLAALGRQGRFAQPALDAFGPEDLRALLERLHVPTVVSDGGGVYPRTQRAATVQTALWKHAESLGVRFLLGVRVTDIALRDAGEADRCSTPREGRAHRPESSEAPPPSATPAFSAVNRVLTGLRTSAGTLHAPRVILATGGRGYPDLGASGIGFTLAERTGHTVVPPVPALVPLELSDPWVRSLPGIALPRARLRIDEPRNAPQRTGELLFTHRGLSGPAVLNLSGDVSERLARTGAPVRLRLSVHADTPSAQWRQRFDHWRQRQGRRELPSLLCDHLPAALADALCRAAALPPRTAAAHAPADALRRLLELLCDAPLTATGTEGWAKAMVTRGGVRLRDVDPRTLQSHHLPGLHFAGELLDLDGPCGGYNLQWAFASGYLAGASAGQKAPGEEGRGER